MESGGSANGFLAACCTEIYLYTSHNSRIYVTQADGGGAVAQFTDEWLTPILADLVGPEALDGVRGRRYVSGKLWQAVVSAGLVSDREILDVLSQRFRLPVADLSQSERTAREAVPEQCARQYHIMPLNLTESHLEIATANPFDLDCEKTLAFATGREVRIALASPSRIQEKIDEHYRPENVLEQLIEGMGSEAEIRQLEEEADQDLTAAAEEAAQRPVVRLVDLIISEGILARASDIHIEPEEGGIAVRFRIDGVLREHMKIPRAAGLPLISRIKIISGLDIADRLRPQDGRARVAVDGIPVDLRISTLPAAVGEKVVVRILDATRNVLALDSLGMSGDEVVAVHEMLENRDGIVLVTGPTGSGKTTTLYAAIQKVQSEGVNIVTVEDPVEYRMPGIVQVQTNERTGLTFASALRSILRQDPDVVLVGEIRDLETAQIAVQASLTGHLVLSTLHTNDAANAVTRLVDIGLESFKIAAALRGVIAQRLMRSLCPTCKDVWTDPLAPKIRQWVPEGTVLSRAVGCPECAMTGYRGRFSIVEVLKMTPEVERAISRGAGAVQIAEAGRAAGMRLLWESGLSHVLRGGSTIDELLRVVDVPQQDLAEEPRVLGRRSSGETAAPRHQEPLRVFPASEPSSAAASPRLDQDFDLIDSGATQDFGASTVLLVDDEAKLRKVMRDLLERDGYVVLEAQDGVEALDLVDRHAPDVVVLDLHLPGLDGFGVLERLRSRPETEQIPVVVLTARGEEDNEVRVFEMGADDFLSKPFRARALSARLRTLIGRRRQRPPILR